MSDFEKYGEALIIRHPESLGMMDVVEQISKAAQGSGLSGEFYAYAKSLTDIFMQRQRLSFKEDAVILAVIIYLGGMNGTTMDDILRFLGCDNMTGLRLKPVFARLMECGLVEFSDNGMRRGYTVPDALVDDYNADKPFEQERITFEDNNALFCFIEDMIVELDGFGNDTKTVMGKISKTLKANNEMPIIRQSRLMTHGRGENLLLVLHFCAELCLDDERKIRMMEVGELCKSMELRPSFFKIFRHGDSDLFKKKIVEFCVTPDGLVDTDCVQLTDEAVKKLLPDYKMKEKSPKVACASIIKPEQIKETQLFFDEKFRKQVDDLACLLQEDNFRKVQKRLVENGFSKGFCSLFYGAPGTGKTALAKELARRTGRSIMLVDLSSVRDKYVGESEKNVQAIFEGYQRLYANSRLTPILVLNEAEALITRRNGSASTGVDKMENAMQNIMLQGMEDFNGILIATTNLADGMDPAFDRRFLYKLEFPKPSKEVSAQIWRSKMPTISDSLAHGLASQYNFSGGQIENVARKTLVDSILHGEENAMRNIKEYCQSETINKIGGSRSRIGF